MSNVPWWGLPLIAALFALAGAAAVQFMSARNDHLLSRRRRTKRWYEERKTAYVALLAVFERDFFRLRAAFDAGEKPVPALVYMDEVGPALMQVRLLASGPVRSAALAVHVLLQKLHGEMNPAAVIGVQPEIHFRELLTQVPLVMQQFEASIREELGIETAPPVSPNGRVRSITAPGWTRRDRAGSDS
ncbi:hypothetical protein KOI35_04625 [Actinoplanes bogorensis]|uniref:Uncharacterized protein n=1 Tax=Paractinoplanes bogorensis TaxID=1610840 RepID=A0ABS5YH83_9ACTN|nr:hypothetical protein [Actinoplanes bogorensis]MBU2662786.1 hypothetical protein [Actinoplanes bogorensis]